LLLGCTVGLIVGIALGRFDGTPDGNLVGYTLGRVEG
jgi:hypothetical protein